ncbi:MAG TPA: oxygenase MpaB family protein [Herpetosiphonaceae bacterium]
MHYTDALLDRLRFVGDPEPDRIIAELAHDGQIESVNSILRHLMHNSQPIPADLPDNIEFWLRDMNQLPAWVDRERIERAANFFVEHGMAITLLLSTSGLVGCYAAQKGVKVLTFTYRLGQNPYHRIAETGQFVLWALTPGGLFENGNGLLAALKVRLMHAAIRHLIRESGRWDEAELGLPINQEDLLGTLMVFSYGIIWGLRELGIRVSDEEAEDYLYAWRVIGSLLGIDPTTMPTNCADCHALAELIAQRQHGPSAEGVEMTRALLKMHADLIPGSLFDGIVPALIRKTIGDQLADWLEIPRSSWEGVVKHAKGVGRIVDTLERASGATANLLDHLGIALLNREAIRVAEYERGGFAIPTALRDAWSDKGMVAAQEPSV